MGPLDVVKAALLAYVDKDRAAIEALIADNYSFTSPLDNALDRQTYFTRCWPNSQMMVGFDFITGAESGDTAWIVYEGISEKKHFRNAEVHKVKEGKLIQTEVYFGWDVPHPVEPGEHKW